MVNAILDDAFVCHVSFLRDGLPSIFPTSFCRIDDKIYLHGAAKSGAIDSILKSKQISLAVTHVDGIVLTRSAFNHSLNYRSVIVFGKATDVVDQDKKERVLGELVNKIIPGRYNDVRKPLPNEMNVTRILEIPITEAVAKTRSGPPSGDEKEELEVWSGVIPVKSYWGEPVAAEISEKIELPEYIRKNISRRHET